MMKNEKLLSKLLEKIEQPLTIELPENYHYLPTNKQQLEEANKICDQLMEEYASNDEAVDFLKEEKEWIEEGFSLLEDSNTIPLILIDKLSENASLKIDGSLLPSNTEELNTWKHIISFFKDLNPTDKNIIKSFKSYTEFIEHYDGNEAFQITLQEIAENIYTQKGINDSCDPANKDEVLQAMNISLNTDDFDDFTPETIEQINNQQDGFDYLIESFGITQEDFDSKIKDYKSQLLPEIESKPNAQAYDYVNKMYENLSYIDKEGGKWAASANEVEEGFALLNKAEEVIDDPDDTELLETIQHNREHLEEANVRRFAGAWWLIVCASIVSIILLVGAFKSFDFSITTEQAAARIENTISSLTSGIEKLEAKDELTKDEKKKLNEKKKYLKDLQKTTPEKYARQQNRTYKRNAWGDLLRALISFAWIAAYYFAARPYGYDRNKRQRQYAIIRKATGGTAKVLSAILGAFWSMPITTYITKYTDGSKEKSNDALFVLAIQLFVTAVIVGMVLLIAQIIIPFATIIAYIRNYPGKIGAKQVHKIMGNGKDFAEKHIDRIKNKSKKAS